MKKKSLCKTMRATTEAPSKSVVIMRDLKTMERASMEAVSFRKRVLREQEQSKQRVPSNFKLLAVNKMMELPRSRNLSQKTIEYTTNESLF